ncbi:hypothetical protein N7530_008648 [Penicillium desertorum]|uniref:Uncharacterized protein n=1 Tax=Penicillium desertorum TaxID=1303715 RepID=A0A9X0BL18_9EURO|nr:hypothetical protein N7530_008648 [Penicillium desertorum]
MNGASKADLWVNAWNTDFSTWSKKISTASSDTGALSTGAKAGTGAGVSVAGLVVLSAFGFVLFQRRLRPSPQEMTGSREAPEGSSYMKHQPAPQELSAPPPEIDPTTNTRREMM